MNALLIVLNLKTISALMSVIITVRQSVMVSLPIIKHTAAIMATDATFTASKKADNAFEFRSFFIKGLRSATKTNEGKNMASVEIIAPDQLLI